jgi:hypothetical protein
LGEIARDRRAAEDPGIGARETARTVFGVDHVSYGTAAGFESLRPCIGAQGFAGNTWQGAPLHYWSMVENSRVSGGRTARRHVLYLGEINDTGALHRAAPSKRPDEDGKRDRSRCAPTFGTHRH